MRSSSGCRFIECLLGRLGGGHSVTIGVVSTRRQASANATATRRRPEPGQRDRGQAAGSGRRRRRGGWGRRGASRHQAVAAIIAPLSVQSSSGGRNAPPPGRLGRLEHPGPQAGVGGDAAADARASARRPRRPRRELRRRARRRPPPGTTRRRRRRRRRGAARTWLTTAVLSPENEKSNPSPAHRPRERDRGGVAVGASRSIAGPAGIAEAEEPRDLVERLAGGVVDRLAEQPVPAVVLDHDEHRVPTRRR